MPSGYTADIYQGKEVTGKEFITKCARAFGATVMMRDEPLDKEIPEFQPSDYHLNELKRAEERLVQIKNMSIEEAEKAIKDNYRKEIKSRENTIQERNEMRKRYEQVLADVNKWIPPTKDHDNVKKFAIDQLKDSMQQDCDVSYYERHPVTKQSPQEYINMIIEMSKKDIEYHTREYGEEVKRAAERNLWVKQLRDSLK